MRPADVAALATESLRLHRLRTVLSGIAVAIGVAAVLVLAGVGDAAKRYVVGRFAAMGANLVTVSPGRTETSGMRTMFEGAERALTLDDCDAIRRRVPGLRAVAPVSLGTGAFRYGEKRRDVYVVGVTAEYATMRELAMERGRFLPPGDPRAGGSYAVIGRKLAREVFGAENPVGRMVRIGERRFRVIGVLAPKGQSLGFDFDDLALIPVATGLTMFDKVSLFHIIVQVSDPAAIPGAVARVKAVLVDRHRGEDFTVVTQDAMLKSFRAVLDTLTAAVAGIAAIAVAVAGIGIMNVMLIAVSERIAEVGLLKALGARSTQVTKLFLVEALLLSALGAVIGIATGLAVLAAGARLWPAFPLAPSPPWIVGALALALTTGGLFGLIPARRAAALPPAEALQGKR
ncbi:MAG TPA: ABC transporter permease [Candidatus Saccharimonadaceae bacterium]|jgi:putative ABC transport system permease protein|nr:ABC transporter permease [Candidatus Saccharimonadaceae bacterium]